MEKAYLIYDMDDMESHKLVGIFTDEGGVYGFMELADAHALYHPLHKEKDIFPATWVREDEYGDEYIKYEVGVYPLNIAFEKAEPIPTVLSVLLGGKVSY